MSKVSRQLIPKGQADHNAIIASPYSEGRDSQATLRDRIRNQRPASETERHTGNSVYTKITIASLSSIFSIRLLILVVV